MKRLAVIALIFLFFWLFGTFGCGISTKKENSNSRVKNFFLKIYPGQTPSFVEFYKKFFGYLSDGMKKSGAPKADITIKGDGGFYTFEIRMGKFDSHPEIFTIPVFPPEYMDLAAKLAAEEALERILKKADKMKQMMI